MFETITQTRFLVAFVSSFIFSYTLGYQHLAQASLSPNYQFFSIPEVTHVALTPIEELEVIYVQSESIATVNLTDYKTFPGPSGDGSFESYRELFEFVASNVGLEVTFLAKIVAMESSFRTQATPGGPDSAKGLFQFTDDTWEFVVKRHGQKFGITLETSPFDPKANTTMAAMWLLDNIELLEQVITDREVTEADIYLTHFLGRTGVQRFIKAEQSRIAARDMRTAASRNRNIFYEQGEKPRTYEEIYVAINQRFDLKAQEFNIN